MLNIYDANRNARLSLFEFNKLCTEVLSHSFGSSDAIEPLLRQREIAALFKLHAKALGELFEVYAPLSGEKVRRPRGGWFQAGPVRVVDGARLGPSAW